MPYLSFGENSNLTNWNTPKLPVELHEKQKIVDAGIDAGSGGLADADAYKDRGNRPYPGLKSVCECRCG